MSATSERSTTGCFPLAGPVPYLTDDPAQAAEMLTQFADIAPRIWWHATYASAVPAIMRTGLIPSCWHGGDTCVVFGTDDRFEVASWRREDWVIEIRSAVRMGPDKAWWVPPASIVGAWHGDTFHPRDALLRAVPAPSVDGCSCPLAALCRDQQAHWMRTWN